MSGAAILERWRADRTRYIRDHLVMAVFGALAVCLVLGLMGNADWWVGLVAAPAAIAVRGFYLASEELALTWELTGFEVRGSQGKRVPLPEIEKVRTIGSAVQLVTRSGDKHLMKYMADPAAIRARIEAACNLERGDR